MAADGRVVSRCKARDCDEFVALLERSLELSCWLLRALREECNERGRLSRG